MGSRIYQNPCRSRLKQGALSPFLIEKKQTGAIMIRKIKLSEKSVQTLNGEFKEETQNEKEIPLLINHRAMHYGIKNGYIKTTVLKDIMDLYLGDLDLCYNLIYLAAIGADPSIISRIKLEDFIEQIDLPLDEVTYKVETLFRADIPETLDEFTEQLKKVTEKSDPNKKK